MASTNWEEEAREAGWAEPEERQGLELRIKHLEATLFNYGVHWRFCSLVEKRRQNPLWILEKEGMNDDCDCGLMDIIGGESYKWLERLERERDEYDTKIEALESENKNMREKESGPCSHLKS